MLLAGGLSAIPVRNSASSSLSTCSTRRSFAPWMSDSSIAREVNLSTVFSGQLVGLREAEDQVRLVRPISSRP